MEHHVAPRAISEPEKVRKREAWVDALKGYLIFYVTLGHLGCNLLFEKHIYSFHMFLFFFMSGYVDQREGVSFREYLKKKTKRILVPFLLWNTLSNFIALLQGDPWREVLKTTFLVEGDMCWNAPLWFLLTLYLVQVLSFLWKKFFTGRVELLLILSFLLWFLIPNKTIFLKLNLIPIMMVFYSMGVLYREKLRDKTERWFSWKYWWLWCLCFSVAIALNVHFGVNQNVRVVYTQAIFGNKTHCIIAALSGVVIYLGIFRLVSFLSKSKILLYLGKNTLVLMASQYMLFEFYDFLAGYEIHLQRGTIKALILCGITMVVICLLAECLKYLGRKNKYIGRVVGYFGI